MTGLKAKLHRVTFPFWMSRPNTNISKENRQLSSLRHAVYATASRFSSAADRRKMSEPEEVCLEVKLALLEEQLQANESPSSPLG